MFNQARDIRSAYIRSEHVSAWTGKNPLNFLRWLWVKNFAVKSGTIPVHQKLQNVLQTTVKPLQPCIEMVHLLYL